MANNKSKAKEVSELEGKRLDVLRTFFQEEGHSEIIKEWENKKMQYEAAKFQSQYIKKYELFPDEEDPQLKLF